MLHNINVWKYNIVLFLMVPDNHYNDLKVSVQENENCVYHTLNTLRIAKDKALVAMR